MFAAMYWNQARWLVADEVAAHQPDVLAQPALDELRVERAIERLVLGASSRFVVFGSFATVTQRTFV